eukprot:Sdes_comp24889_c0_seq1m22578
MTLSISDEVVFDLLPPEKDQRKSKCGYTSIYSDQARKEYNNNKQQHASMGIITSKESCDPKKFMKKGYHKNRLEYLEKRNPIPAKMEFVKPKVPRRNEKPIMGIVGEHDFIKENAISNIRSGKKSYENGIETFV